MKNKLIAAVLSLVIAVALWAYVITVQNPEWEATFYNVPVVLQSESALTEKGLMLTSGKVNTITLKLSGNRSDLNKLKSSDITVVADLSRIYDPGTKSLTYDVSFPGYIPDNSVSVQSREPSAITVEVDRRTTKRVAVQVAITGSVPEGYIADKKNPVLDYPVITVDGPDAVVSLIDHARIDVDLTGRNESISESYRYTLCDAEGNPVDAAQVTTNVEEVRLDLRIQMYKEIELRVNVVDGGGATAKTSTIVIEPATISVSGSDTALSALDGLELGTINLAECVKDTTMEFDVELPEGINNESGVSKATVKISFPALKTRVFTVTTFQPVNVPEGMEVEFLTTQLDVSVRGTIGKINAMKASDITVLVDFAGEEAGTATLNATISLTSGFSDCGALNSYSVSATIRPVDENQKK